MVVDYFILNQDHYTAQALADPQGKLWYQHGFNWIALGTLCLGVLLYLGLKSIPVIRTSVGATFITMGLVAVGYYLLTKGINRKQVN